MGKEYYIKNVFYKMQLYGGLQTNEEWENLEQQKSISTETFLNAFLTWSDILDSIKEEINKQKKLFDINEEHYNKKNKGTTLDRTTHYRVSANTRLAKQCLKDFGELTRLHATLLSSNINNSEKEEEEEALKKFIAFIDRIYDEIKQHLNYLNNAIWVAKKQSHGV